MKLKGIVKDISAAVAAIPAMVPAVSGIGAALGVTPVGWACIAGGAIFAGGCLAYTMWNRGEEDNKVMKERADANEQAQRDYDKQLHPELFANKVVKTAAGDKRVIWDNRMNLALHPDFLTQESNLPNFQIIHDIFQYIGGVSNLKYIEILRDDDGYADDMLGLHLHKPIPDDRPQTGGRFLYEPYNERSGCPCAILTTNNFIYPSYAIKTMMGTYIGMCRYMEKAPWEELKCDGPEEEDNVHIRMDIA